MRTVKHDPFWSEHDNGDAGYTDYVGILNETHTAGEKEVRICVALDHDGEHSYVMITEEIFDGGQNHVLRGIEIPLASSEAVYRVVSQSPKSHADYNPNG